MSCSPIVSPLRHTERARLSPWRTIWAVARYELALQGRTPLLWTVVVLLLAWVLPALLWAPSADFPSLSPGNPNRWQDVFSFYNFTAVWCALVAPLGALAALRRDRGHRAADLLWTRPLDAGTYVIGKALALAFVLVPLTACSEILYWVLGSLRHGAPVSPPLVVVQWAGVTLPVVLFAAVVALALTLLLRHPAAALLCWWAAAFGLVYAEVQSISQEFGGRVPAAFPVHIGPYRLSADVNRYPAVLVGGALIVLGITLALLSALPVLYRVQQRAIVLTRDSLACMLALLGAALLLAAAGTLLLHSASGTVVR